ncbi:PAS domain S-box protein [Haloarcula salina]|uniref:histidine kinase n=1 Tax=Haloarcula salina TaxID=1429914 RepID=A0AA41KF15_9EURY|nr:PAS domain S-box protein [Haloarcula salina]MBV0901587.1 PAS domain S-box protein [Haloarcula salina]
MGDEPDEPTPPETRPDSAERELEVLVLDADETARRATHDALSTHRPTLRVTSVGTPDDALAAAASSAVDCLVVDPAGLDDVPDSLVSNDRFPVVLYSDRDPSDLDSKLRESAATTVQKQTDDRREFLAQKIKSVVSPPIDRREYALSDALSAIESRAADGEIAALVDERGDIVWTNGSVSSFVAGDEADADIEGLYDVLAAAMPDTPRSERRLEQLRDRPTAPLTVRVTAGDGDRYLLRRGYDLPDAAGGHTLVVLEDVTDTATREARTALLELLVDHAQDGLYTLDERGVIDFCNDSFAAHLGYEPSELRGRHASTILAPGELETGQRTIEHLLETPGKQSTTVDLTFVQKDGTKQDVSIHYTLIYGEGDRYRGLMGVVRNITERRERERKLRETTERLNLALEGAELGVWDWNPKTNEVAFDERWTGMLGFDPDELEPCYQSWADLVHPEDLPEAERELEKLKRGDIELYETEFRMRTTSGEWKWVRDIGKVFERNDDGEAVRAVGIHQDVTERRERQRAIERQRDELATLDRINVLIQDLIGALGGATTRAEIAESVCDRIVESAFFEVAWIGERTGANDRVVPRTVSAAADIDPPLVDEEENCPSAEALKTREVRTVRLADTDDERWHRALDERDLAATAAIPLVRGDVAHGVLCVCATRQNAFSPRAVESFAVLGEMIGLAFTAAQNRRLLARDTVLELTFESERPDHSLLTIATEYDCRLESAGHVDLGAEVLFYLSVEGASPVRVLDGLVAIADIVDGRVVRGDETGGVVELQVEDVFQSRLLDVGARATELVVEGGTLTITVEAPPDADSRTIQETLSECLPPLSLTSRRERERERVSPDGDDGPRDSLTDRQREVLRTAYLAGYYAWPRDTNAEELADTLGIASPTLHQHLRRAERNLIDDVFDF